MTIKVTIEVTINGSQEPAISGTPIVTGRLDKGGVKR